MDMADAATSAGKSSAHDRPHAPAAAPKAVMAGHGEECFQEALLETLRSEGGYADRPKWADPGGATNLGITHGTLATYRGRFSDDADMPGSVALLTRAQATRIYRRLYWEAIKGDELPCVMAGVTFDAAVHSGPARAAKWLQEALGVKVDGHVGPLTVRAAWDAHDRSAVAGKAIALREDFLRKLKHAQHNPGWWSRLARLREVVQRLRTYRGGES